MLDELTSELETEELLMTLLLEGAIELEDTTTTDDSDEATSEDELSLELTVCSLELTTTCDELETACSLD